MDQGGVDDLVGQVPPGVQVRLVHPTTITTTALAALAVAAVEAFLGGGEQPLSEEILSAGLAAATSPGRLEIVRRSPTVIVDAAHNPAGAQVLAEALKDSFTFSQL